jgi:hypothetical protein
VKLLKEDDRRKISDFKKRFAPSMLPDEVIESRLFRTGTEVPIESVLYEFRQREMQAMSQRQG